MAVAILAVASDGKLKGKEIENLKGILISNPLFDKVEDAGEYMGCIAAAIVAKGRDSVLEAAAGLLNRSLRETAYSWAVYMVATDRKFVKPEHRLLEYFSKVLAINQKHVQAYFGRASAYGNKGDHDKAINDYSKVTGIDPNAADAYKYRGQTYARKGEYDQALSDYSKASDPENIVLLILPARSRSRARKCRYAPRGTSRLRSCSGR